MDGVRFRVGQRRDWESAAKGWHDWQELIFDTTAPLSRRLRELAHLQPRARGLHSGRRVELAELEPGDRVLDVAAGTGEPSLTAAQAVGPEGQVVATDISPEMLSYDAQPEGAGG